MSNLNGPLVYVILTVAHLKPSAGGSYQLFSFHTAPTKPFIWPGTL